MGGSPSQVARYSALLAITANHLCLFVDKNNLSLWACDPAQLAGLDIGSEADAWLNFGTGGSHGCA
jgi:hypothetical protein